MVYLIGLIVSVILWLYTLSKIFEKNDETLKKAFYTLLIVIFPMFGVLYAIYDLVYVNFMKSKNSEDKDQLKIDKDPYHRD